MTPSVSVVRALAVATAVLVIAGLVLAVRSPDDGERAAARRPPTTREASPSTTSTAAAGPGAAIEAVVADLQRVVEKDRGLAYKRPVKVTLLDDAAFRQRIADEDEDDKEEAEAAEVVLRALGLLDTDVDLEQSVDSLLEDAIAGFYDPKTDELVVRGERTSPQVRAVLVHELTHALQDQWFELERPDLDKRDDEAGQAFEALVEGDAMRVEQRYRLSLPAAERRRAEAEEDEQAGEIDDDVPEVLLQLLAFPYQVGPDFVRALVRTGGQTRLDSAFGSPPTTSEHLLHPNRYLENDAAKPVAAPKADGKVVDQGVLGELGLLLVLAEELPDDFQEAAEGWGGDRYVAWTDGPRNCIRANVVMDTPADTEELAAGLRQWAEAQPGASIEGTSPIILTSCA